MTNLQDSKSMVEEWVSAIGHPCYEVSNLGRLRRVQTGCIRATPLSDRYVRLRLDGRTVKLHRLVLESFTTPEPTLNALHKDGNTTNNQLNNLYWGTQVNNYADARKHGTAPTGEKHGQAKLTKEQVDEIAQLPKYPGSGKDLALRFGISPQRVCDIRNGRGWT